MARRKRKKKRGIPGCGLGSHQEASPMARATATPSRKGAKLKADRRSKQQGWIITDE